MLTEIETDLSKDDDAKPALPDNPVVQIAQGAYRSRPADQGVLAFLGIPYARPPIGQQMWIGKAKSHITRHSNALRGGPGFDHLPWPWGRCARQPDQPVYI